ncbi:MAG: single-stranded-DNA-specific exonuclease RecJ [Tissierellia bacterium]|nr:single-stranded-DNA-specific exonuclease RecJ [Tissierellia bacterium]
MEKWLIKSANIDFSTIGKTQNEKILYRIIANRGIDSKEGLDEFLNPNLSKLHSPESMADMEKAADILINSIEHGEKIRIVGDYDVDGIMSTYILYKFISGENPNVDYQIPHRITDGYGLNVDMVTDAIKDGVKLIITCDNGISAFDAIDLAKKNDIKVIVLDHHEPKISEDGITQITPKADAVVDPKRDDCQYPFKGLCGGAIAYKFVDYVSLILGYDEGEIVREYLEFAAIATVCDVMDLIGENRIIVYNGLKLLNNTTNLGLKTLISTAAIKDKTLDSYHLGFIIGPMFNASGRLDTATKGLELLLEENVKKAAGIALDLKNLNLERTKLTKEGLEIFIKEIEATKLYDDKVIVAYIPNIHESIAGIIAGRVKEKYNKPTIILTKSEEFAKGSARSIDEYDITKGIAFEEHLLNSFGGHKLAAGVSLPIENIETFRTNLNENSNLTEEDFYKKVYIDLGLPISFINQEFIESLKQIAPYGNGNPKPLFGSKDVKIGNMKIFGKDNNVLKVDVREGNEMKEGILFSSSFEKFQNEMERMGIDFPKLLVTGEEISADIVYQASINEWNGKKNAQLIITNFRIKEGDNNV